ncbi:M23 family metallopeptidase [Paenibacillus sp. IB182496]|uniref:M23 family metallopeptidase n=1 Tax=Paenibacillus sabuli TaxID=2772509 RepID=A0A927BRK7_9BACL|nr:M23 family metallopeptidase [Paenibacillus sabuli]MBD2844611.1 M23 family metallopeptidase [Paenibacillus sabuli]
MKKHSSVYERQQARIRSLRMQGGRGQASERLQPQPPPLKAGKLGEQAGLDSRLVPRYNPGPPGAVQRTAIGEANREESDRETRGAPGKETLQPIRREARADDDRDPEALWKAQRGPWRGWSGDPGSGPEGPGEPEGPPGGDGGLARTWLARLLTGALVFVAVWMLFQLDTPWARRSQAVIAQALTDEMDFARAAAWYADTFADTPVFIPFIGEREPQTTRVSGMPETPLQPPLEGGVVVRPFAELLSGVEIAAAPLAEVHAIGAGRVLHVSAGEREMTVVIQHTNDRMTVYGRLRDAAVAMNDWVTPGQSIGTLADAPNGGQSTLYLAIKQQDRYIDPAAVIPLD